MPNETSYKYVIVGGGLAGASAVEGIRQIDTDGAILLLCGEDRRPYHRPPLSKGLWTGKKKLEKIHVHNEAFYADNGAELVLGTRVASLDPRGKTVTADGGRQWRYEKLLLATGGEPRRLDVPGGELDALCYFRGVNDYLSLRPRAGNSKTAVVVGGGFIGSELAAALTAVGTAVTMVYPGQQLCSRVFPPSLGRAVQEDFRRRGVTIRTGDKPVSFARADGRLVTRTAGGGEIASDIVVVGVGIAPATALAESAGLRCSDGIEVDELLRTSDGDIFAAGDDARFPYKALGRAVRVEHWDNARAQGRQAGRNMAGAAEPYDYMPYFFSDLFDLGYEAVGDVDGRGETFADWQSENVKGVVYYRREGKVRGALMCGVWDKVDSARELIRAGKTLGDSDLRGAIR